MSRSRAAASAQIPLRLPAPPDQRLSTFVQAPPGAMASLHALAVQPCSDWLFVEGPPATGKTHLLLAVCAAASEAGRRAAYVPLRSLSGRLAEALIGLDASHVAALDDVHLAAGNREAEVALFDFHNRMRDAGNGVLYAAAAAPAQLPWTLPDLRSRLGACTRISLTPLDDAGRAQMLLARAKVRGLRLEPAAVEWLLKRAERDPHALIDLFERLDRASLATQRRITVPFLAAFLDR